MADETARTSEEIDCELLTAYLDGELSDTDCMAVEKRLAEDPEFHNQMRDLQSAWEMLDSLPLVQPNSHFVQTTVEMAIGGHPQKKPFMGLLLIGLAFLLIPTTAFGLSYFLKRESIEQPERELVYDLPLIENHDRYDKVVYISSEKDEKGNAEDGIKFLKSILGRGLFREVDDLFPEDLREDPPADFTTTSQPPDPQRIRDRSDRLSRMTDQQRSELFEKKKKFEAWNEQKQRTMREFHDLLAVEPQRHKLAQVLSSYYDWLKILGASQRASLLDLPLDKRLREIGRITSQQAQDAFGTTGSTKLPIDDAVKFYQWYDFSIRYYNSEIRERVGEVFKRMRDARGLPTNQEDIEGVRSGPIESLVEFLMRNDRDRTGELLCENTMIENVGIDCLREIVSDEAREIIDQPDFSELDRQELILKWIEAANKTRFPVKSATLKTFYSELSQEQRDKVDNLHPDERYEMLTRMHWKQEIGEPSSPTKDEEYKRYLRQNGFDADFFGSEDDEL